MWPWKWEAFDISKQAVSILGTCKSQRNWELGWQIMREWGGGVVDSSGSLVFITLLHTSGSREGTEAQVHLHPLSVDITGAAAGNFFCFKSLKRIRSPCLSLHGTSHPLPFPTAAVPAVQLLLSYFRWTLLPAGSARGSSRWGKEGSGYVTGCRGEGRRDKKEGGKILTWLGVLNSPEAGAPVTGFACPLMGGEAGSRGFSHPYNTRGCSFTPFYRILDTPIFLCIHCIGLWNSDFLFAITVS